MAKLIERRLVMSSCFPRGSSLASHNSTSHPRLCNDKAVSAPTGPPPTTRTCLRRASISISSCSIWVKVGRSESKVRKVRKESGKSETLTCNFELIFTTTMPPAGPPVRERYNAKARGSVAGGSHKKRRRTGNKQEAGEGEGQHEEEQPGDGRGKMSAKKRKRMDSYIVGRSHRNASQRSINCRTKSSKTKSGCIPSSFLPL